MKSFGVLGGDLRQLWLARALADRGHPVALCGLENAPGAQAFPQLSPRELPRCDIVVLPLPVTRDGACLYAPFAAAPLPLDGDLARCLRGPLLLGGMVRRLESAPAPWPSLPVVDYAQREELLRGNAALTAEAAVGLAIQSGPGSLWGSRCLVTGFGRVGKALCRALAGLGAQVDCAARKPRDRAAAQALGCRGLDFPQLCQPYDFLFNTVPAPVVGEGLLARQGRDALLLELASAPGGFDRAAARRLGLSIQEAPGLPGKCSPKGAGLLLAEALLHMLEERRDLP